jgi:Uma2 family endonuclease
MMVEESRMSIVPSNVVSEAEYLALERISETRHEFYRGQIFAMAGATANHSWITDSLIMALRQRLSDQECRPYSRDMRVYIEGLYTYPDVVVACPPKFKDDRTDSLINPCVVIEVLSPSTEAYDRGKKFDLYRQSQTLEQYVLVAQDSPRVISYVRQSDGVAWLMNPLEGFDAVLNFPTLATSIPFKEIFRDIEFATDATVPLNG